MQKDTKSIVHSGDSVPDRVVTEGGLSGATEEETVIIVPPDPSDPRKVMRDGQEVFVETRTGTGATVPGMKSIAGESGQSALRLHETIVPAPTSPAETLSGEVLAGGRQAAVPDADFRHVNEKAGMADPLAPTALRPVATPSPGAKRFPLANDAVIVDGHEGRISKVENGVVTEVTLNDGRKVPGTGFTYK